MVLVHPAGQLAQISIHRWPVFVMQLFQSQVQSMQSTLQLPPGPALQMGPSVQSSLALQLSTSKPKTAQALVQVHASAEAVPASTADQVWALCI